MLSVLRVVAAPLVLRYRLAELFGFPHVGMCDNLKLASHAPRGPFPILNGGVLAVLFCFLLLCFAVAGGA
jgi:putative oxidoreductase